MRDYNPDRPVESEDLKVGLIVHSVMTNERLLVRALNDHTVFFRTANGVRLAFPRWSLRAMNPKLFFHLDEQPADAVTQLTVMAYSLIDQANKMLRLLDEIPREGK